MNGALRAWAASLLFGAVAVAGCGGDDTAANVSDLSEASVRDKTLHMYRDVPRVRALIRRLLEGYEFPVVRQFVKDDLAYVDSAEAALLRTDYQRSPDRVRFMEGLRARRSEMTAFADLLRSLEARTDFRQWFPREEICHDVQTSAFNVSTVVRGSIEAQLRQKSFSSLSTQERGDVLGAVFVAVEESYPSASSALARVSARARQIVLESPDEVLFKARVSWLLQIVVEGTVKTISCPGDEVLYELHAEYDGSKYYNYGQIPRKDIQILRADTAHPEWARIGGNAYDPARISPERYGRSHYQLAFGGVDEENIQPLASPHDPQPAIVTIESDGTITRGELYSRYFTAFGMSLPSHVKPEAVPSLVHVVDHFLAGKLERVEVALALEIVAGVEVDVSLTVQ